jgi:hypothetical protein
MYFPYDRMSLITFNATATTALTLGAGDNLAAAAGAINAMRVANDPASPVPCNFAVTLDARGCTNTNTGEGLRIGGGQFGAFTREEAVWIVILLSDGGANAGRETLAPFDWICPAPGGPNSPTWVSPFCRDNVFEVLTGAFGYDAEDDAQFWGAWVGCPDANSPQPAACAPYFPGGQGAVIFTIGLGDLVVDSHACDPVAYPPGYPTGCEVDVGEELLRYIAGAGDDGDPGTDPCSAILTGVSCGNYYFSPTGAGLNAVFEAIASRIFTRLTH